MDLATGTSPIGRTYFPKGLPAGKQLRKRNPPYSSIFFIFRRQNKTEEEICHID